MYEKEINYYYYYYYYYLINLSSSLLTLLPILLDLGNKTINQGT